MRFLIRGPEGQEFELTDVDYFLDEYEGKGFDVVTSPPTGYDVPDVRAVKAERREAAKKAAARAETKADAKADDGKKDA
jgi:hypothetical protein